jgi:hypothetical protein
MIHSPFCSINVTWIAVVGECIIRYYGRPCDEVTERVWPIKISDGARVTLFNKGLVSCDVNQSFLILLFEWKYVSFMMKKKGRYEKKLRQRKHILNHLSDRHRVAMKQFMRTLLKHPRWTGMTPCIHPGWGPCVVFFFSFLCFFIVCLSPFLYFDHIVVFLYFDHMVVFLYWLSYIYWTKRRVYHQIFW